MVVFREENSVVIELGSYTTRALRDITDINTRPSVQVRTRAGVLKPEETEKTEANNKPEEADEGVVADTTAPEDESAKKDNDDNVSTNESNTEKKVDDSANGDSEAQEPSYVFGSALESAEPGTLESVADIMSDGFVTDWEALSAFLRYILKELGIRIAENYSPILFAIPPTWSKTDQECLVQIAFEHLNAPGVVISEQPLLTVFGNGAVSGLVVDIGHTTTAVSAVIDSCIVPSCVVQSPVAGQMLTDHLRSLLLADKGFVAQFDDPSQVTVEFVSALKESGLCKLELSSTAADDTDDDGDADGDASGNTSATFEYADKKYVIPKAILHTAPELLIHPPSTYTPLSSIVKQVILSCEADKRVQLWENINVVGGSSQIAGLKEYLQFELESTVLATSNIFATSQAREVKFASLPDYFSGWRNCDHLATFVGACIAAKYTLNDSKHNVTRAEYNERGPGIVHRKEP
ncbi:hypothetical protein GGI15_003665 [Coemansia interrupta]|uniref:Actin n=1 Tax=Coemansia interrupta TaxID=1126814 RepID=A0A9W8HDZ6_9FUNG|nr:hypothetical protein GGI15_003665 [Coemansia interrupta]